MRLLAESALPEMEPLLILDKAHSGLVAGRHNDEAFALVLGARLRAQAGNDDVQQMHAAEPVAWDSVKPPELED